MTNIDKLKKVQEEIKDKNNKIYFFIAETEQPSAGVYEIYHHASTLKRNGYDVTMLTDKSDYNVPKYIDDDMKIIPHVSTENTSFNINASDFLIIPEIFSNVMETVKELPCKRIVFAQSFTNALRGLVPGMKWKNFGVTDVISTNSKLTEKITEYFGKYDIKEVKVGIPYYFKKTDRPKDLVVSFVSRNPDDATNLFKLFTLKYPQFSFITFQELKGSTREEFANELSKSAISIWMDRKASFGTFPLESMACGTIPICLLPDIGSTYMEDYAGVWTDDFYKIPELLSKVVSMWFQDSKDLDDFYTKMEETAKQYTTEESEKTIMETYNYFFDKRIKEIEDYLTLETAKQAAA